MMGALPRSIDPVNKSRPQADLRRPLGDLGNGFPGAIKAVLFDMDGTLYRQRPLRLLMALELATLPLAGPGKALARLTALRAFRKAQEELRLWRGDGPPPSQTDIASRASGLSVAEVDALVADWMIRRPLKYLQTCRAPGLTEFLGRLDQAGIRAGLLSDYPAEAKLKALGLEGRFWPVLCSSDPEIAEFKPGTRGYRRACELWQVEPGDVLSIGDRVDVDAPGSMAAGMQCAIIGRASGRGKVGDGCIVVPSFNRLSERLAGVVDGK